MRKHKWEAFNPNGSLCELCGVAKDTVFAEGSCTGRVAPKDVEIDELKARVAELQADYKSLEIMARKWRECSRRWQEAAEAKSGEGGTDAAS